MKTCPKCNKPMKPVLSARNPRASEWYCVEDHWSILMTVQEIHEVASLVRESA